MLPHYSRSRDSLLLHRLWIHSTETFDRRFALLGGKVAALANIATVAVGAVR